LAQRKIHPCGHFLISLQLLIAFGRESEKIYIEILCSSEARKKFNEVTKISKARKKKLTKLMRSSVLPNSQARDYAKSILSQEKQKKRLKTWALCVEGCRMR
jgi:hypothetical protein